MKISGDRLTLEPTDKIHIGAESLPDGVFTLVSFTDGRRTFELPIPNECWKFFRSAIAGNKYGSYDLSVGDLDLPL